ncbi:MAG: hypothetical protein PVJ39_18355 [Gammaproteobacteria bacterium]|jgi:hypothetical protein
MVVIKRIFLILGLAPCLYSASSHAGLDISTNPDPASISQPSITTSPSAIPGAVQTPPASSAADKPSTVAMAIGAEAITAPQKRRPELAQLPDNDNNLRLLEIRIGKYQLEELLPAYQYDDIIFIPLGYFSELIDLAIQTDPSSGIAQGFIFQEDRRFYLDTRRGEVTINGKLQQFNRQRAALREFDDIYVDSYLIGKWLPLKLDIDLFASRVKVIPDQPLPFQQRKQREERIAMVRSRLARRQHDYPLQVDPSGRWSYPLIDQTVRAGVFRDANGEFSGQLNYTTYATADLMHHESSWYITGSDNDVVEDARVTFAKKDPTANLLGYARATQYAFGHISEPQIELVTRPFTLQPGVFVSNYPLTRQLQYDSHNFRGDLPPGWEVELYRNNTLLDYQAKAVEGQYRFDEVPLLFGANYFRLVFYGPQGQVREETRTFNLNEALTPRGKHYYRATLSKDEDFGARTVLEYDAGITNNLSIAASLASIPVDDTLLISRPAAIHHYLEAGIRGFSRLVFFRADVINDTQSGSAVDWDVQTRIRDVILKAGETYFNGDFISEEFPESTNPIERRSRIKLDTAIPTSWFPRIPISFAVERDHLKGGTTIDRVTNSLSGQQHGFAVSNTLTMNRHSDFGSTVTGILQASRRAFGYNFRGTLNYQTAPNSELVSATVTTDGFRLWNYHIAAGLTRDLRNDSDEVFFNMNRSHGAYALGLNTRYATGGVMTVELNFSMGLGREPRTGSWLANARPVATSGTMSTLTFLDNNNNGKKDAGEPGIENVKLRINGGTLPQLTDQDGIVYINGLEPYRDLDVELVLQTLEDPLWQPSMKGKRVRLRPGHVTQVNFPVVMTGEIDGTAFIKIGEQQREVRGVIVELVDNDGTVVQTAETAYDGFYLMSGVPVGRYQLRISGQQTQSLNLAPVPPIKVSVSNDNPVIYGQDFVLEKQNSQ